MKKVLIIAIGLLVIVSCKKEETGGGNAPTVWPDYLVGTWNLDNVELTAKLVFQGFPVTGDGESVTTMGGYTFNSDNSFSYDWSSEVAIEFAGIINDTIPVDQKGSGVYNVLGESQIQLISNGDTSLLDIKSKSVSTLVVELEDKMEVDGFGEVELEIESILSK